MNSNLGGKVMTNDRFTDIFFKEHYFSDFYLENVGHEKCSSKHRFGPNLRERYIFHYIVKGKGEFTVRNCTYSLKEGDFFLIRPNELIEYGADEIDPWEYYWVGFSGDKVDPLLLLNGIGKKDDIGRINQKELLKEKLANILKVDFFDERKKFEIQAAFFDILSFFTLEREEIETEKHIHKKKQYRESFLLYIQNYYYREDLTIEEIARSMYLHPSYFSQLIKEELDLTALEYLTQYRMNKASVLLTTTSLSVEEVSHAVGYKNRHSFSRAFKRRFKCTATEYREKKS